MIQKAAAMSTWLLTTSSDTVLAHASCLVQFFGKTLNHPDESDPYSPDLVPSNFWLFPEVKSPLKGRDFRPSIRFRKCDGATNGDWENCLRSQGA